MDLAGVDLNLLVVFDAIMKERHVTRAGERIGLSQPAMSAALNRLRHLLKDDLFIRRADGMNPTRRAQDLAEPIRQALAQIQTALEPQVFDPAICDRTFKLASNDFAASILIPRLGERLYTEAPNVNLNVIQADDALGMQLLYENSIDLAIAPFENPEKPFQRQELLAPAGFLCAMRQEHPLTQRPLTLEAFANAPHLLVSRRGDASGFVDDILADLDIQRRVALTIPSFLLAPAVLSQTNYVAVLPERLVALCQGPFNLFACEPPFPQRLFAVGMLWHQRSNQDLGLTWLKTVLTEIAEEVESLSL